ncbi:unnamed protein product [Macrosiphum euphorbiae]|uniref:Uncharacterized protein n=1 Tax=Macrosiphum euphorbiae TaxID=13131 RepID=A0AAV0XKU8_9HEMI|nr:unnamed protein product [Macrosiphum euphorbiae]
MYQTSNGSKAPKKLMQDISTRWNSTYYMLERFVELEDAIRGTLGLLDNPPQTLSADEWKITKELIQVLRPFEEATKAVSGSKYMTASIILVISQGLKNVCEHMARKNFTVEVINVLQQLLSGMNHRDRWGVIENKDSNSIPEPVDRDENVVSIWKTIDTKVAQLQPTGIVTSRAIIEVQRYLEDSIINRNCDPLKWWLLMSDRRCNLSSKKAEMLLFLNQNT